MSTASRLISGSAASWVQIIVTLVSQMALVPIYLTYWNVRTYGVWLAINALVSLLATFDFGYQEFIGFEFFRFGKSNISEISKYLCSGILISIIIGLIQIFIVALLIVTNTLSYLIEKANSLDSNLLRSAGILLLVNSLTWIVCASITGLITRALMPFGYYPRIAWWNLINSVFSTIIPIITVISGADILTTGIVSACASLVFIIPFYLDLIRLLKKEGIHFSNPSLKLGYNNFIHSTAISGKSFLENIRHQGARLVLAPLAGATSLAAFSTMRTGANVALQGLHTITNPLMPELMRFLHQRDQARSEAAFGTVWFVLVAFMAPCLVLLQAIVHPLFSIWTKGQVPFNPLLFATLSLSVLVYAVIQPAIAVVRGNNLLKIQLKLSALAAGVVIGGICLLVPTLGILGAGIALLASEVAATVGYRIAAQNWLELNGLAWPKKAFRIAVASVWLTAIAITTMAMLPTMKWLILLGSLLMLVVNIWRYWQMLPPFATQQAKKIVLKLPILGKLLPV